MIERLSWDAVVHPPRAADAAPAERRGASWVAATSEMATSIAGTSEIQKAREAFTAMVLQSFLDAAVPKNLSGAGQSGAANTMWRSLLVDQLAKSIAASGQLDVLGHAENSRLIGAVGDGPRTTTPSMRRQEGTT